MKRRIVSLALASIMAVGSLAGVASADTSTTTSGSIKSNVPFINGNPDGTFRPAANVTRAEVAKMVATRAELSGVASTFPDTKNHWASNYIGALADKGMIGGFQDGTFRPEANLTRGEAAKILVEANGGVDKGVKASFPDAKNHWASEYIAKAEKLGIVKGFEDGNFRPDAKISREETVALVNRAYGRFDQNIASNINKLANPFKDVEKGRWSENIILAASLNFDYTVDAAGKETIVNINAVIDSVKVTTDQTKATVAIATKDAADGTNATVEVTKGDKVVETKRVEIKSNAAEAVFEGLAEGDYKVKVTVGASTKTETFTIGVKGMVVEGVDTVAWPQNVDYGLMANDFSYNPEAYLTFKVNGVEKTAADMEKEGYTVRFETIDYPILAVSDNSGGWDNVSENFDGRLHIANMASGEDNFGRGTVDTPRSADGATFTYMVELEKDGVKTKSAEKKVEVLDKSRRAVSMEVKAPKIILAGESGVELSIDKLLNAGGINTVNNLDNELLTYFTVKAGGSPLPNPIPSNTQEFIDKDLRTNEITFEALDPEIAKIEILNSVDFSTPANMRMVKIAGVSTGVAEFKITVAGYTKIVSVQVVSSSRVTDVELNGKPWTTTYQSNLTRADVNESFATPGSYAILPSEEITLNFKGEHEENRDLTTTDVVSLEYPNYAASNFEIYDTSGSGVPVTLSKDLIPDAVGFAPFKGSNVGEYKLNLKAKDNNGVSGVLKEELILNMGSGANKKQYKINVVVKNGVVSTVKVQPIKDSNKKSYIDFKNDIANPSATGIFDGGNIAFEAIGYDASGNSLGRVWRKSPLNNAPLNLRINGVYKNELNATGGFDGDIQQTVAESGVFVTRPSDFANLSGTVYEPRFKYGSNKIDLVNRGQIGAVSSTTYDLEDGRPSIIGANVRSQEFTLDMNLEQMLINPTVADGIDRPIDLVTLILDNPFTSTTKHTADPATGDITVNEVFFEGYKVSNGGELSITGIDPLNSIVIGTVQSVSSATDIARIGWMLSDPSVPTVIPTVQPPYNNNLNGDLVFSDLAKPTGAIDSAITAGTLRSGDTGTFSLVIRDKDGKVNSSTINYKPVSYTHLRRRRWVGL